jgi:hypothetical protein
MARDAEEPDLAARRIESGNGLVAPRVAGREVRKVKDRQVGGCAHNW